MFGTSTVTQMLTNIYYVSLAFIGIRERRSNTTVVHPDMMPEPNLIPRLLLFGSTADAWVDVELSPDGRFVSFIAPLNGVANIWLLPIPKTGPKQEPYPVTFETGRGIGLYSWTYLPGVLLYGQDTDGDENWKLYRLNVTSSNDTIPISTTKDVSAEITAKSRVKPEFVLVGLNDRDPRFHDLYQVDLITGEKKLLFLNNGFKEIIVDHNLIIRLAARETDEGGTELVSPKRNNRDEIVSWESYRIISLEDDYSTKIVGFHADNEHVYWSDSTGLDKSGAQRNLAALVLKKFASPYGAGQLIYQPKRSDIQGALFHPSEYTPIAVKEDYLKPVLFVLDKRFKNDFHFIFMAKSNKALSVQGLSQDMNTWLLMFSTDDAPSDYYIYHRMEGRDGRMDYLFTVKEEYLDYNLSKVYPVEVRTTDNYTQVCYVGLPVWVDMGVEIPTHPLPLVMDIHGGPWQRDFWGFDAGMQHLTNRGYAVMRCNYRGSLGYGKRFFQASFGEWAGKMHQDILDGVKWAVSRQIADPTKVAIIGGSYGGYETLVGLSFTPEVFACGVDVVGPSNLLTLVRSIPPYWLPLYRSFLTRIGADPDLPKGRTYLTNRSPLFHANNIQRPLLIAQGANDPRVNRAESDQIVRVLKANDIPVSYIVFPDEGHGFARHENQEAYRAVMELFLADCLGGRSEPVSGELEKSSIQIVEQGTLDISVSRNHSNDGPLAELFP